MKKLIYVVISILCFAVISTIVISLFFKDDTEPQKETQSSETIIECNTATETLMLPKESCEKIIQNNGVSIYKYDYQNNNNETVCFTFLANDDTISVIDDAFKEYETLENTLKSHEAYKYLLSDKCTPEVSLYSVDFKKDFGNGENSFYLSVIDDKVYCRLNYNSKNIDETGYEQCLKMYKKELDE